MKAKLPQSPFLYPILDAEFSKDPLLDAQNLIRAGVEILQYRAKHHSRRRVYDTILQLSALCSEAGVPLIVNDCVDVALVTEAAGVHLGQEDFPADQARMLLGEKIIGVSTHNAEQFFVAQNSPIDYIAIGPVYETATKQSSNPVLGIENITPLIKSKSRPVVAIGGIRKENFGELIAAGADGVALISELYREDQLYSTAVHLLDEIRKHEKV